MSAQADIAHERQRFLAALSALVGVNKATAVQRLIDARIDTALSAWDGCAPLADHWREADTGDLRCGHGDDVGECELGCPVDNLERAGLITVTTLPRCPNGHDWYGDGCPECAENAKEIPPAPEARQGEGHDMDPVAQLCYSTPQFASLYEGWEETGRDGSVRFVRVHSKPFARTLMLAVDPSSANVPSLHAAIRSRYGALRAYGSFVRDALAWVEVEVPTQKSRQP